MGTKALIISWSQSYDRHRSVGHTNFCMACIAWDTASIEVVGKLCYASFSKNKNQVLGGHLLVALGTVTMPR